MSETDDRAVEFVHDTIKDITPFCVENAQI